MTNEEEGLLDFVDSSEGEANEDLEKEVVNEVF